MTKEKGLHKILVRDISWLAFNARVLQEAGDPKNATRERLRFLGIFSNNLDEFFRVRVAALNRLIKIKPGKSAQYDEVPAKTIRTIQQIVVSHQREFEQIYSTIIKDMAKQKIAIVNEKQLGREQKEFVTNYFNEKVRTNIFPLMIESIPELPLLNDKSIYLACTLNNAENSFMNSYALIEIPTAVLPRFVILPENRGVKNVILLEDIIRFNLPKLFNQFGFNQFEGYIVKVTRDAELDLDSDLSTDIIEKIEKGIKNRKKGKALRFVYDKSIPKNLLVYLNKLLNLTKKDHAIPGGRIHNFKDFMDFPSEVFTKLPTRNKPFIHPLLTQPVRILDVIQKKDVMLHFPYHSFDSIIDLLREAAIDPFVLSIKITCYRLAKESKIVNALVNAVRNGKEVTVVIELKARFDEEANLKWKTILEEAGVKVLVGFPNMKIHAKLCLISKKMGNKLKQYGFVSTGNLNENTSKVYADHCLMTAHSGIMKDIEHTFKYIEHPTILPKTNHLILSPFDTRKHFVQLLEKGNIQAAKNKPTAVILKLNSLSDPRMIQHLYQSAIAGLDVKLIVRGIYCAISEHAKFKKPLKAISIVDEYLEHARVLYFNFNGLEEIYISSADWMTRNLDFRIEASTPIYDASIMQELKDILQLQLKENEKGRILDNELKNEYVVRQPNEKPFRAQLEIYNYLRQKKYNSV